MKMKTALGLVAAVGMISCGMNPFGSGAQGGLDLYAKVGKNMERPKAINDEENGKDGSKTVVKEGVAASNRLAKRGATGDPWVVANGIESVGDTLVYFEIVKDKPSEEDAEKLMTGRAEVRFGYGGAKPAALANLDTTKITDLFSFTFVGRENKTWKYFETKANSQLDSVDIEVLFSSTGITNIKPGKTRFWAKNISKAVELGAGDTAKFVLDSLGDAKHTQYGKGVFLDAHSGKQSDGKPSSFAFDIEILHKNSLGGNPYLRYEDNEGTVTFMLPWGSGRDSLHFSVHFSPGYDRDGVIRKNGAEGPVLVEFQLNEKSGKGTVTYKNESGEVIGHEST